MDEASNNKDNDNNNIIIIVRLLSKTGNLNIFSSLQFPPKSQREYIEKLNGIHCLDQVGMTA